MFLCISDGQAADPFSCAYRNEKFSPGLNITIDAEAAAFRDLIEHSKARRGVFVDKGYERCISDKPGNTCYSLWGLDQTSNNYVIIRQGKVKKLHIYHHVFTWNFFYSFSFPI